MSDTCAHGFARDGCLICRTLASNVGPATGVATPQVEAQPPPDRPDVIYAPRDTGARRHRSFTGSLVVALAALLAVGAAAWILVGLVFTVLHILELIAVGAGCGWVGYKVGHFRGARHARSRGPSGGR